MADSIIHLPGGGTHSVPSAFVKPKPPPEHFEPYPDEHDKITRVWTWMSQRFGHVTGPVTEKVKREFNQAAATAFGDIGFTIEVEWFDLMNGQDYTGRSTPRIIFTGRTTKEEQFDHDRMAYGVVRGMADGVKGYIREDGKLHDDPIKKNIY